MNIFTLKQQGLISIVFYLCYTFLITTKPSFGYQTSKVIVLSLVWLQNSRQHVLSCTPACKQVSNFTYKTLILIMMNCSFSFRVTPTLMRSWVKQLHNNSRIVAWKMFINNRRKEAVISSRSTVTDPISL